MRTCGFKICYTHHCCAVGLHSRSPSPSLSLSLAVSVSPRILCLSRPSLRRRPLPPRPPLPSPPRRTPPPRVTPSPPGAPTPPGLRRDSSAAPSALLTLRDAPRDAMAPPHRGRRHPCHQCCPRDEVQSGVPAHAVRQRHLRLPRRLHPLGRPVRLTRRGPHFARPPRRPRALHRRHRPLHGRRLGRPLVLRGANLASTTTSATASRSSSTSAASVAPGVGGGGSSLWWPFATRAKTAFDSSADHPASAAPASAFARRRRRPKQRRQCPRRRRRRRRRALPPAPPPAPHAGVPTPTESRAPPRRQPGCAARRYGSRPTAWRAPPAPPLPPSPSRRASQTLRRRQWSAPRPLRSDPTGRAAAAAAARERRPPVGTWAKVVVARIRARCACSLASAASAASRATRAGRASPPRARCALDARLPLTRARVCPAAASRVPFLKTTPSGTPRRTASERRGGGEPGRIVMPSRSARTASGSTEDNDESAGSSSSTTKSSGPHTLRPTASTTAKAGA